MLATGGGALCIRCTELFRLGQTGRGETTTCYCWSRYSRSRAANKRLRGGFRRASESRDYHSSTVSTRGAWCCCHGSARRVTFRPVPQHLAAAARALSASDESSRVLSPRILVVAASNSAPRHRRRFSHGVLFLHHTAVVPSDQ